jgi:hypothetical protein
VLACGGEFNSPAGFIDFPVGTGTFYEHSVSCDYIIRVSPGMVVNLTFSEFRCDLTRGLDYNCGLPAGWREGAGPAITTGSGSWTEGPSTVVGSAPPTAATVARDCPARTAP